MNRITYITRSLASHALCAGRKLLTGATVVTFATLALASCNKDEAPNTGAFNPNATLSLSTATVEGLATRAGNTTPDRTAVEGFVDGDVIQIEYDFDGDYTTPEGGNLAYAKLSSSTWTIYTDIELTTVAKLRPNPNRPEESWEKLALTLNFNTRGIVTDADGKKKYGANAVPDPVTNIITYYDVLIANIRSTTPSALKAKEYSVGIDGRISVCFAHERALLSLSESALIVGGYTEGYNGISALTGITEENSSGVTTEETIALILKPGTEPGKGTWQAIASTSYETNTVTLKSLTATLAKDGTPGTPAHKITIPIATFAADGKPVALQSATRYPLSLTIMPTSSVATITGFINGWSNEEGLESIAIEGIDYKLAEAGNKTSDWTIITARGLAFFRDYVNKLTVDDTQPNATLANDIDLNGSAENQWMPIENADHQYDGTFDGAGHTISGLYIAYTENGLTDNRTVKKGLFGTLSGATVQHLTVKGSIAITDNNGVGALSIYAGGIAGNVDNSIFKDCHSAVNVSTTGGSNGAILIYTGGIAGKISEASSLSDCSSNGAVTSTVSASGTNEEIYVGGICGLIEGAPIINCNHTVGTVSAIAMKGSTFVGGIAGIIDFTDKDNIQIIGCTNTAEVKGSASTGSTLYIGGMVGLNFLEMVACSNTGAITYNAGGTLSTGGIVGESDNAVLSSFSTEIPKVSTGGSGGTTRYIGGVIGQVSTDGSSTPYPINACFYVNDIDLGSNGIGNGDGLNNANGGRVANLAGLNGKVNGMNTAITTYNNNLTGIIKCPYHWVASTTAGTPTLSK